MVGDLPPRIGPLLLLLALVAGCAAPRASWRQGETPEATEPPAPIDLDEGGGHAERGPVHVVAPGENLYRIALRYGVDMDELADLNEISDPRSLSVGRELRLPAKDRKGAPSESAASTASAESRSPQGRQTISKQPPLSGTPLLDWPVKGVLFSRFGKRGATRHDGIDIAAPEGTAILAAADGDVIYAGVQRGYGRLVILRHEDGLVTIYAHNRENLVRDGMKVRRGQPIGKVGRTGRASGPHCHFEVRRGTTPMEPLDFLPP
ncbi:peptidoglycan DD-metalloendopeptidase family protein [Vulgatibacter incomptus]|uniref:Membrane protein related to metalloendopeptidase n=1 Tax=Vulgatibacter incomptus TaxID=1391653 RepID=A0A0K1PAK8_9BACT|nr:M23 family metallopeptidase [Vulgatibacter incomptus]AKU90537.1 Membrane protein related to metalloendopeptidase [Vulgatibacter incomptus]